MDRFFNSCKKYLDIVWKNPMMHLIIARPTQDFRTRNRILEEARNTSSIGPFFIQSVFSTNALENKPQFP